MKAIRYAGAAVCLALAAYFMAPLVMGILHIGMVYPAALLALAAAMLLRPRWFRRLPRWLRRTGGALLGAGLALLAAVLVMMAVQAGNRPGGLHRGGAGVPGVRQRRAHGDAPGPHRRGV